MQNAVVLVCCHQKLQQQQLGAPLNLLRIIKEREIISLNVENKEASDFLSLVSRGRNPDVSPEAKGAFEKSLSFISKIRKLSKKDSVASKSSDSDVCVSDSDDNSSRSDETNEVTINEECSNFHNVQDLDDIDSALFEKCQDWVFEDVDGDDGYTSPAERIKNDYVNNLKKAGGLYIHAGAAVASALQNCAPS